MTGPAYTTDQLTEEVERKVAEIASQLQREERRKRLDFDVRGLLAIITVVGFFLMIFAQLVIAVLQGQTVTAERSVRIPAEVAAVVTGVAGFYFGSRSNGGGGR